MSVDAEAPPETEPTLFDVVVHLTAAVASLAQHMTLISERFEHISLQLDRIERKTR